MTGVRVLDLVVGDGEYNDRADWADLTATCWTDASVSARHAVVLERRVQDLA
ncbi:hypothetical protein ACFSUJ_01115 [Streptomyces lusitanus]|uniref:Uncharacterized protein n=1 Tax=Streptomyces lusitanus TaxID=68232 RepID=A0ABU3JMT3_9ACTN|nr:hypothetical protein [Streptomyces lusitanus]